MSTDRALALSLWDTGNVDAQFLATLLIEPKNLPTEAMDRLVRSFAPIWINAMVSRQG